MDIFKKFSFINVKLMGDILTGLYCRQRPEQKKAEAGTRVPASAFFCSGLCLQYSPVKISPINFTFIKLNFLNISIIYINFVMV